MDPATLARLAALARHHAAQAQQIAAALEQLAAVDTAPPVLNDNTDVVTAWYRDRVAIEIAAGRRPSREDDYRSALAAGLPASHALVRRLRAEFAPSSWSARGRPRQKQSLLNIRF
ncbi:MAG: hypothetical protein WAS21_20475 [Geminicoccaceae bacterium]